MTLKATPWESKATKLVPWEEDILLTPEQALMLLELQAFAASRHGVNAERYTTIVVPTAIFDKLAILYDAIFP